MKNQKPHILVVDDEYTNRFLLTEMLESYEVSTAANGSIMWKMIAQSKPDLILLDVMMPGEDGFSIAKKIHDNPEYKNIPIIFVTAKSSGSDIDEGFRSGAFDYIKKPFNQQELETRVKKALENTEQTQELLTRAITGDMVFENMLDGLFITDKEFRIVSLNPVCSTISGYTIDELESIFLPDLVCDEYQNPISIGKLMQKKNEVWLLSKFRELIPISVSVSLVSDDSKNELGWICIFHDIRERKAIEQNLISAKEKAEKADKMKSIFLANMSHEIRTPLNSILGFSDLLGDEENTPEERQQYVQIIKKNGEKLLAFIENLLDISSLEAQQIKIQKSSCRPAVLLHELYHEFLLLKKKNDKDSIAFEVVNHLPQEYFFLSDDKRLHQCLFNILDNAFKYTKEGEVSLSCNMFDDSFIDFNIQDTGIGIEPEFQNIIFENFQKSNNKLGNTVGIGLGLAISKNIVKVLGGSILLKSEPNVGSTFTVRIPIQ